MRNDLKIPLGPDGKLSHAKVLDRVRKLVALSASNHAGEADAAAAQACRLIRDHGLSVGETSGGDKSEELPLLRVQLIRANAWLATARARTAELERRCTALEKESQAFRDLSRNATGWLLHQRMRFINPKTCLVCAQPFILSATVVVSALLREGKRIEFACRTHDHAELLRAMRPFSHAMFGPGWCSDVDPEAAPAPKVAGVELRGADVKFNEAFARASAPFFSQFFDENGVWPQSVPSFGVEWMDPDVATTTRCAVCSFPLRSHPNPTAELGRWRPPERVRFHTCFVGGPRLYAHLHHLDADILRGHSCNIPGGDAAR